MPRTAPRSPLARRPWTTPWITSQRACDPAGVPVPNFQTKYGGRAYATPQQLLAYRLAQGRMVETPPPSMVISWQRGVLDRVRDSRNVSDIAGPGGGVLQLSGGVGFVYLPAGAPMVAIALEELAAMGTRTVVGLGTAGAIAPGLAVGDVVVCSAALRDDGTSHHYERDGRWAAPDEKVAEHLRTALPEAAFGSTWTTDAPYRETIEEIAAYQREGVLTVDMEASALFTVGACLGVRAASVFCISDVLNADTWQPHFYSSAVEHSLWTTFERVETLLRDTFLDGETE